MSSEHNSSILESLRQIVGEAQVRTDGDLSAWELDWRKRVRGKALAVVLPGSTAEVAAVVKACALAGVPIVPQGGNTGMVAGGIPDDSGRQVVLNLGRMQNMRSLDPDNLTLTVDAGCILQNVQAAAEAARLLFPLSLGAEGSCTIRGNLATNAGGTQVIRYGNARELCLGLEVVTPQGEVWDGLSGLRKNNTGYDLRDLFIGSEGTLGVITAATLKLVPAPVAQLAAWVAVPSMECAVSLLSLAHRMLGSGLTGFEVMGQFSLSLVARHMPQLRVPFVGLEGAPYCVLIECSDIESFGHARARFEALLESALEQELMLDAVVAESLSQAQGLWHVRESITPAQADEGPNIKHDISLPVSRIPAFVAKAQALLAREFPDLRLVNFGHLGDGNLHFNLQAPQGAMAFTPDQEERISAVVYDTVAEFGGSISAEHGVGSLKVDKLPTYKAQVELQMMQAIKRALDPAGLFNPGRVIRV